MRNIDRIRQMSLEELPPLLVKDKTIEFNDLRYSSPSGNRFYDEDGAVDDCVEWLDSEYDELNLSCRDWRIKYEPWCI